MALNCDYTKNNESFIRKIYKNSVTVIMILIDILIMSKSK